MSHAQPRGPRRASARVYARRRAVFAVGLLLVLAIVGTMGFALLRPVSAAVASPSAPTVPTIMQSTLPWPSTGVAAIGAVGYDGVLDSSGAQTTTPIASMTKTITALVVLDKMPLKKGEDGPVYTLSERDTQIYDETIAADGSSAPVVIGAQLTERQMLEAMLIPSANNYATALADWAYGSVPEFLAATRIWLDKHGLTDTVLADASGISEHSMSSPPNLLEIGKMVIAHPVLKEIVALPSVKLPIGEVKNTNKLLGSHGIIGLKTGTTFVAGACLLYAVETTVNNEKVTIVGVEIGADTHNQLFTDVAAIAEAAAGGFHPVTLATEGESFGTVTTEWGGTVDLVADATLSSVLWQGQSVTTDVELNERVSGNAGDVVGQAVFTSGTQKKTVDLVLADKVSAIPNLGWRLAHIFG